MSVFLSCVSSVIYFFTALKLWRFFRKPSSLGAGCSTICQYMLNAFCLSSRGDKIPRLLLMAVAFSSPNRSNVSSRFRLHLKYVESTLFSSTATSSCCFPLFSQHRATLLFSKVAFSGRRLLILNSASFCIDSLNISLYQDLLDGASLRCTTYYYFHKARTIIMDRTRFEFRVMCSPNELIPSLVSLRGLRRSQVHSQYPTTPLWFAKLNIASSSCTISC